MDRSARRSTQKPNPHNVFSAEQTLNASLSRIQRMFQSGRESILPLSALKDKQTFLNGLNEVGGMHEFKSAWQDIVRLNKETPVSKDQLANDTLLFANLDPFIQLLRNDQRLQDIVALRSFLHQIATGSNILTPGTIRLTLTPNPTKNPAETNLAEQEENKNEEKKTVTSENASVTLPEKQNVDTTAPQTNSEDQQTTSPQVKEAPPLNPLNLNRLDALVPAVTNPVNHQQPEERQSVFAQNATEATEQTNKILPFQPRIIRGTNAQIAPTTEAEVKEPIQLDNFRRDKNLQSQPLTESTSEDSSQIPTPFSSTITLGTIPTLLKNNGSPIEQATIPETPETKKEFTTKSASTRVLPFDKLTANSTKNNTFTNSNTGIKAQTDEIIAQLRKEAKSQLASANSTKSLSQPDKGHLTDIVVIQKLINKIRTMPDSLGKRALQEHLLKLQKEIKSQKFSPEASRYITNHPQDFPDEFEAEEESEPTSSRNTYQPINKSTSDQFSSTRTPYLRPIQSEGYSPQQHAASFNSENHPDNTLSGANAPTLNHQVNEEPNLKIVPPRGEEEPEINAAPPTTSPGLPNNNDNVAEPDEEEFPPSEEDESEEEPTQEENTNNPDNNDNNPPGSSSPAPQQQRKRRRSVPTWLFRSPIFWSVVAMIVVIFFVIIITGSGNGSGINWSNNGTSDNSGNQETTPSPSQDNVQLVKDDGTTNNTVSVGQPISYTIKVEVGSNPEQEISVSDALSFTPKSNPNNISNDGMYNDDAASKTITWDLKNVSANSTTSLSFSVIPAASYNNQQIYDIATANVTDLPAPTTAPTTTTNGGTPSSDPTCGGKYTLKDASDTIANPFGNFGDPDCNFTYDRWVGEIKANDPGNFAQWKTIYNTESASAGGPNAYNPNSTSTTNGCGGIGAFGLYQLNAQGHCTDSGTTDEAGNVEWHQQVKNGISLNNRNGGQFYINGWGYDGTVN
ncbi:MAG TPA: hypothetical protein VMR41_04315 [Patescibacteria group bacterium]|nr:hypothetical protein [Patescibacteria group bacterium]